jgi:GalNAc-alpha-(1->4)-GalNAc-alpha-(1->3)-diNAcBac-PP-undecaprenol alpha-1,4-N-acetyl-D-galactosaminyltransferase
MNIAFTVCSLGPGGAEHVLSVMANHWARRGWNVTVITYENELIESFYKFHPDVRMISLGMTWTSPNVFMALFHNLKRIFILRGAMKRLTPDCVISMMDNNNVVSLLASVGLKLPVVITEHTFPALAKRPLTWRALRRLIYPMADFLVVLSEECKQHFSKWMKQNCIVIPNPVEISSENSSGARRLPAGRKIYAMGRLTHSKRFDLLLHAFALVSSKQPDCHLVIIGDGPMRGPLYRLRHALGLTDRVHFTGLLSNPTNILKDGELFVMSSEYEGFPLAILEAMACGLPVVAFDCHGCNNIVQHGVNGILVPPLNVQLLSKAILNLLVNDSKRRMLGEAALEVKNKYSINKIMDFWDSLVRKAVKRT